jgi:hypothetical protein
MDVALASGFPIVGLGRLGIRADRLGLKLVTLTCGPYVSTPYKIRRLRYVYRPSYLGWVQTS